MIRAATDPKLRLPTVSTAGTTIKAILSSPWEFTTAVRMPGIRHAGPLPELTGAQRALSLSLRRDVEHLAVGIGERNVFTPNGYRAAESWLASELAGLGLKVERQVYDTLGVPCVNLSAELPGKRLPGEVVVYGAHYDSLKDCPAANDNGSGVAAVLALARHLCALPADRRPDRSVRFVFFANEEPPFFYTDKMGSRVYADACRSRNEQIVAMLTPETIGCYSDAPGSQLYPLPLLGRYVGQVGDYVSFVGVGKSAPLVRRCVGLFREKAAFPSVGAALPSIVPGVGASDHWSFWRVGYPALMVTDTAPFRYRYYHTREDLPDKMDFERMARVVDGLHGVVESLAAQGR